MALKKKVASTVGENKSEGVEIVRAKGFEDGKHQFILLDSNPDNWLRYEMAFVWKGIGEGDNRKSFNNTWVFSGACETSVERVLPSGRTFTIDGGDSFNDPFIDFGLHNPQQLVNKKGHKFTPDNLNTVVYVPVVSGFSADENKMYDGSSGKVGFLEVPFSHVKKLRKAIADANDEFEDGERTVLYGNSKKDVVTEDSLNGRTVVLTRDSTLSGMEMYQYRFETSSISKNAQKDIDAVPELILSMKERTARFNAEWMAAVVDAAMNDDKEFSTKMNSLEAPIHKTDFYDVALEMLVENDIDVESIIRDALRKPFFDMLETNDWNEVVDFFYSGAEERVTATSVSQATVTEPEDEELVPF